MKRMSSISRRNFLGLTASATVALLAARRGYSSAYGDAGPATQASSEPLASGPFTANWTSLQQYKCPDWFRDAKFGMWCCWSAQCVPEQGDWYARNMYLQGTAQYNYHVKNYGHPSKFGFMELTNLWKAENWDAQKLMSMYKRAGAKYFVTMANHHDNFDNYDSKYHNWNSVKIGPRKDIVGAWAKAARNEGLKFGVSNHASHAWHWFQVAYGYDGEGPLAGARYDAFTTTADMGKGKWWDGFDPQELYAGKHMVIPDGITTAKAVADWHQKNDRVWYETPPPNDPGFAINWMLRAKDLINQHKPDLLYFDDTGLPFGDIGVEVAAHFYNTSIAANGKLQAVMNAKMLSPEQRQAMVEDYERGFSDIIQPLPWQTDTCIGNWHYQRDVKYKTAGQVARMLVDIVSKNGNLLLNIPIRGDGTIDDREVAFVGDFTKWMDINSQGIFGSRPWRVYGEGPTQITGGMFQEAKVKFTPQDVRFTSKDGALYVYLLGVPTDDVKIATLGTSSQVSSAIAAISLLGSDEQIKWTQAADGLVITKPTTSPSQDVVGFKVTFKA